MKMRIVDEFINLYHNPTIINNHHNEAPIIFGAHGGDRPSALYEPYVNKSTVSLSVSIG